VCTSPLIGSSDEARAGMVDPAYEAAIAGNLPVVGPAWLLAVAAERR